jgi:hypothetical protein
MNFNSIKAYNVTSLFFAATNFSTPTSISIRRQFWQAKGLVEPQLKLT